MTGFIATLIALALMLRFGAAEDPAPVIFSTQTPPDAYESPVVVFGPFELPVGLAHFSAVGGERSTYEATTLTISTDGILVGTYAFGENGETFGTITPGDILAYTEYSSPFRVFGTIDVAEIGNLTVTLTSATPITLTTQLDVTTVTAMSSDPTPKSGPYASP